MVRRYCTSFLTILFLQPLVANAAQSNNLAIDNMTVVAQNDSQTSSSSYTYDDEIVETSGDGYFHPTLRISEEYTDNLFNVKNDKTSNFLTTITPGFWMTAGQAQDMPEEIMANNSSPGGIVISPLRVRGYNWINASLTGSMDFNHYSNNSDSDYIGGTLSGRLQYMPGSKLALYINDQFTREQVSYDIRNDIANSNRWSNSNIIYTGFDWDITEKFSTGIKYTNFLLKYNDTPDQFMDRKDNTLSWYGAYNYSVKTSFFLEYQYMDLSYDSNSYRDNEQNYFYGGINWASTAKTTLNFKVGYQQRDFKNDAVEAAVEAVEAANTWDENDLALELGLNWKATEKANFDFYLSHKLEESDSFTALGRRVLAGGIGYQQRLTRRLQGTLNLTYSNEDYMQTPNTPKRDDDRYLVKPALQYTFREWLMGELAYSYESRSSTDERWEYDSNTVYLSLNSSW